MTDQTTDTPAPTPETETPAETAARKGRGPTRPEIAFADLVGDLRRAGPYVLLRVLDAIERGVTPTTMKAVVRTLRSDLSETVRRRTIDIQESEAAADLVASAARLTPDLRRALVLLLRPGPEATTRPEVPEGEGA